MKQENEELIKHRKEAFEKALEAEAQSALRARDMAELTLKPGMKLRRHPIDELTQNHTLTGAWLKQEFENIMAKQSALPSAQRNFILTMGMVAMQKAAKQSNPKP